MKTELICEDLKKVVKEAKVMGCKEVRSFTHIPIENVEIVIEALEMKSKYEAQWLDDTGNPLEPLKLKSALDSELFKLAYRKENKPEEINILDYTVIYALKDCLERYTNSRENHQYEKQKLLSDIINMLSSLEPQAVEDVRCSDGVKRTRPLIDIATAVNVVNSFRD